MNDVLLWRLICFIFKNCKVKLASKKYFKKKKFIFYCVIDKEIRLKFIRKFFQQDYKNLIQWHVNTKRQLLLFVMCEKNKKFQASTQNFTFF